MRKQTAPQSMRIADIRIGKRHRKDMGDVAGFAASMAELGLLQPIVIRPDGVLVAGERRLLAAKQLGWTDIAVSVVDLDAVVRGEFAENEYRKNFTPSELVAIGEDVARIERQAAKERQREAGRTRVPDSFPEAGDARDKIGKYLGWSGRTYERAKAVTDAAAAEPEKFGKLLEQMDDTGRVNGVYRRLRNAQQAALIRAEPPPLPGNGPYRGGMADIPWAYEPDDDDAPERGVLPYPTMSIEQACGLDVASIMHADSVLGFWVTNFLLVHGLHLRVLRAWGGFEPKTILTWPKDRAGRGYWLKGQTEHLVIAVRGHPTVTLTDQTTLLRGPFHLVRKGAHSAKPVEAYSWFESLVPAPRYADLFSRYRHGERWDCHGNEAPPHPLDIPASLRRAAP